MDSDFLNWARQSPTTALGLLTSAASVLLTLGTWLVQKRYQRLRLRVAAEEQFKKVMESDSIETLGNYMDEVIGAFRVAEYVESDQVRDRVAKYLGRIQEFVGTTEEVAEAPTAESIAPIPHHHPDLNPQYHALLAEVRAGRVWNALAKLRRDIELRLRELALQNGLKTPDRIGAGRLLEHLTRARALDDGTAAGLKYAINVASRAIHGEEVPSEVAEGAILEGAFALERLRHPLQREHGV